MASCVEPFHRVVSRSVKVVGLGDADPDPIRLGFSAFEFGRFPNPSLDR